MSFSEARAYFKKYYSQLNALKKSFSIGDIYNSSKVADNIQYNIALKNEREIFIEKNSIVQVNWFEKGIYSRATITYYDKKNKVVDVIYPNGTEEFKVALDRLDEPFIINEDVLIYDSLDHTMGELIAAKILVNNCNGTFQVQYDHTVTKGKGKRTKERKVDTLNGYNIHDYFSDKLYCEGNYVKIDWNGHFNSTGVLYPARIIKDNVDGTYEVCYLEDNVHENVPKKQISRPFMTDELVKCYWMRSDKSFKGKIKSVNDDNTFDILYDDGTTERGVPAHYILSQASIANREWCANEETNLKELKNNKNMTIEDIKLSLEKIGYIRSVAQIRSKLNKLKDKENKGQPALDHIVGDECPVVQCPVVQCSVSTTVSSLSQGPDYSTTVNITSFDREMSIVQTLLRQHPNDRYVSIFIPLLLYKNPCKFLKLPFLTCPNYESHYTIDEYEITIKCIHKVWKKNEIENEVRDLIKLNSLNDSSALAMILQGILRNKYDRKVKRRAVTGVIHIDACYEYCYQILKYLEIVNLNS